MHSPNPNTLYRQRHSMESTPSSSSLSSSSSTKRLASLASVLSSASATATSTSFASTLNYHSTNNESNNQKEDLESQNIQSTHRILRSRDKNDYMTTKFSSSILANKQSSTTKSLSSSTTTRGTRTKYYNEIDVTDDIASPLHFSEELPISKTTKKSTNQMNSDLLEGSRNNNESEKRTNQSQRKSSPSPSPNSSSNYSTSFNSSTISSRIRLAERKTEKLSSSPSPSISPSPLKLTSSSSSSSKQTIRPKSERIRTSLKDSNYQNNGSGIINTYESPLLQPNLVADSKYKKDNDISPLMMNNSQISTDNDSDKLNRILNKWKSTHEKKNEESKRPVSMRNMKLSSTTTSTSNNPFDSSSLNKK